MSMSTRREPLPRAGRFWKGQQLDLSRVPEDSLVLCDLQDGGPFTITNIERVKGQVSGAPESFQVIELTVADGRGKLAGTFSTDSIFAEEAVILE